MSASETEVARLLWRMYVLLGSNKPHDNHIQLDSDFKIVSIGPRMTQCVSGLKQHLCERRLQLSAQPAAP
jgi:hypothetical protein